MIVVQRFDVGRLRKARSLPAGGVAVPAYLTRVGVFEYRDSTGRVTRELRAPQHVFDGPSLSSLAHAPVTDLHPPEMVTPANWRTYSVGSVGGSPTIVRDHLIDAELVVNDADEIARIDAGERQEVSCGYTCDLVEEKGVFNGETYDAIQTNIRYNHVALGPSNWGRAGSEVALRLDSGDAFAVMPEPQTKTNTKKKAMKKQVTIDGVTYEIECEPSASQAIDKYMGNVDSTIKTLTAEKTAETQRADAAEKEVAEMKSKRDSFDVDKAVTNRVDLQVAAGVVLDSKYVFAGKSDKDIMIDVVKTKLPDLKFDGLSEDYIRARFDGVIEQAKADKSRKADPSNPLHKDGEYKPSDNDRLGKAVYDNHQHSAEGWKQPLAVSKGSA